MKLKEMINIQSDQFNTHNTNSNKDTRESHRVVDVDKEFGRRGFILDQDQKE